MDNLANNVKAQVITFGFAMVPYLLVTWGYTAFTDGDRKTFLTAFGLLLGVRLFFSLIETLGSVLSWRIYGKRLMAKRILEFFRANKFPKREYNHDSLGNYLARIENDTDISLSVRSAAKELKSQLATFEDLGALIGWRTYSAAEAALDIYSPKSEAKELRFS